MENSIRVSLEFSFRGETHAPAAVIDLDTIDSDAGTPDWHAILARFNQIDTYSYAFEVMQAAELRFSDATGAASAYLADGSFDFDGFIQARGERQTISLLQDIAREVLAIDNLDDEPAIRLALLKAFELGKRS